MLVQSVKSMKLHLLYCVCKYRKKCVHVKREQLARQTRQEQCLGKLRADTFLKLELDLFYLIVMRERGRRVLAGTRPGLGLCGG